MKTFNAIAPAKVNLILDVAPLAEGQAKHYVKTTMQALSLHDTLSFFVAENEDEALNFEPESIKLSNQNYGVKDVFSSVATQSDLSLRITTIDSAGQGLEIPASDNLIARAFFNFANMPGMNVKKCVHVVVDKKIPAQAGLGGGSSDAAATLCACEKIFSNDFQNMPDIFEITKDLGADVAFFLHGGRAKMAGDGGVFEEQLETLKNAVVLVKPDSGVSTAEAYKLFDEIGTSAIPQPEFELFNSLEDAALKLNPEVAEILEYLGENALLCGSGSCCFKICETFSEASKIAGDAQLRGWWTRACHCANIRAQVN